MEIYIQFRKTLFSLGSKGFRRMKTWDWRELEEKFEALFEAQYEGVQLNQGSIKEAEESMRKESRKQLVMKNHGAWVSFNDDDELPMRFDPVVDGSGGPKDS